MSGRGSRRGPYRHLPRRNRNDAQQSGETRSPTLLETPEGRLPSELLFPKSLPRNSNITPKVDIRMMAPITDPILQYRILQHGHKTVKRAKQKNFTEVLFQGDPDYDQQAQSPCVIVDIRDNAPADALTYPRACALAALRTLKWSNSTEDDLPFKRKHEIANSIMFKESTFANRCCINGARYLGKFIAQEMPLNHPAFIPRTGSHPLYGFTDGDLGEWLAAMVAMDYAKMRSCNEAQHLEMPFAEGISLPPFQLSEHPVYDFYMSENVEPKFRKTTLDAITYMGWSDGRQPVTWSELIDRQCKNSVKLSNKDRNRLEQVLTHMIHATG